MELSGRSIGRIGLVFVVAVALAGFLTGPYVQPGFAHLGESSFASITGPIGVAGGIDEVLVTHPSCEDREVLKFDSNGVRTVFATLPSEPEGCHEDYIAISPGLGGFLRDSVYVSQGRTIRKIPPTGAPTSTDVTVFASIPLPCAATRNSLTFDRWGPFEFNLIVACSNGPIWRFDSTGSPTFVAEVETTAGPIEGIDQAPPDFRPYEKCMFVAAEDDTTMIGSNSSAGTVFAVCPPGTVTPVAKWPRAEYVRFVPPIVTSCVTNGAFFQAIFPTSVLKFPQSLFDALSGQALVASEFNGEEEAGRGIGRLRSVTDQTGSSSIVVVNSPFHGNTDTLAEVQLEGAAFCGSVHLPPGAVKRNPPQLNPRSQGEYKMRIFSTPFLPDVSKIHDVKAGRFGREASAVKCELVEGGTALDCHFRTADSGFVLTDKFVPFVVITGIDQGFDGGD